MTEPTLYGPAHDVNTTTAGDQMKSEVIALAGGGYVVIWEDHPDAVIWNSSIRAQIYDAFGQPVGGQIDLAAATGAEAHHFGSPSAVATPDGGFTVVFQGQSVAAGGAGVMGAKFDATGAISGTQFGIDVVAGASKGQAEIVDLGNGEYAVAYVRDEPNGPEQVLVQKIDANGTKIGGPILVAEQATENLQAPALVALGGGKFAVAYNQSAGMTYDVYTAIVEADGSVHNTTLVTPGMEWSQSRPALVADGMGGFTVMFSDNSPADTEAKGVHLDGNGNVTGPIFAVGDNSQNGNYGDDIDIVALANGGSLAVWVENSNGMIVVGQMFDANGNKTGNEFLIGALAPGDNIVGKPSAAVLADGRVVVTWHDNGHDGPDGSGYAIRSQIIDPRGGNIAGSDTGEVLLGSQDGSGVGDVIDAKGGNDKLYGYDGNDNLMGGQGNDTIEGGSGNDTIDGGTGADSMSGGTGNDNYIVDNANDKVIEAVGGGTDSVMSTVSYALAAGSEVEMLTLAGSAKTATGNEFANTLLGNSGANVLSSLGGNDTIDGAAGSDMMSGGLGNDTFIFRDAGDAVSEKAGEGTDTVIATINASLKMGDNVENISLMDGVAQALKAGGNELNNKVTGNGFANTLTGGAGDDTMDGAGGADKLEGGVGNDTYVLGNGSDIVTEAAGNAAGTDDIIASTITRDLTTYANVENLTLLGTADINGTGTAADNDLVGNSGSNVLVGGGGQDLLVGGLGFDLLAGGLGKDTFDFNDLAEIGLTAGLRDRIADFVHGTDIIDLSTIDASPVVGNQKFGFVAQEGGAFTGMKGQLVWDQINKAGTANDVTLVSGDINGDKVADFTIELKGLVSLTATDFIL